MSATWKFLPMRPTRREEEDFQPGACWSFGRYLPWLKEQTQRRGGHQTLVILSARNCPGCTQLKAQLQLLPPPDNTLVVLAEVGDLRAECFFGLELGAARLRYPGVPTTLLLRWPADGAELAAFSLGPLDGPDLSSELQQLLAGRSRACREAAGVALRWEDPYGQRALLPATFTGLSLALPPAAGASDGPG